MADPAEGTTVPFHLPVLLTEVLGQLGARPDGVFVDATVGDGGHALSLLRASSPSGRVCGIDLDPRSLVRAEQRLAPYRDRFTPLLGSYAEMVPLVQGIWGTEARADGVLLDLGISSRQVDATGFGFSFQREEPLDMRFNPEADIPTAADMVNTWPEPQLAAVIREYGEEPRARTIAAAIVRERPVRTTTQLGRVVAEVLGRRTGRNSRGGGRRPNRVHPATRTFQALRIAVNDELQRLDRGLEFAIRRLAAGGRIGVIAFHSLEDRIVKQRLRDAASIPFGGGDAAVEVLTRRPLRPAPREVGRNPRARSARLRVARKVGVDV